MDESTGVRDERFAEHTRRSAFILVVHRAIEVDGLPAPAGITFTGHGFNSVTLYMDQNAPSDVDDWARHLGAEVRWGGLYESLGKPMRAYETSRDITWNGFEVQGLSIIQQDVAP
jgi:hypothetical protein